jgi:hypothetical protein
VSPHRSPQKQHHGKFQPNLGSYKQRATQKLALFGMLKFPPQGTWLLAHHPTVVEQCNSREYTVGSGFRIQTRVKPDSDKRQCGSFHESVFKYEISVTLCLDVEPESCHRILRKDITTIEISYKAYGLSPMSPCCCYSIERRLFDYGYPRLPRVMGVSYITPHRRREKRSMNNNLDNRLLHTCGIGY